MPHPFSRSPKNHLRPDRACSGQRGLSPETVGAKAAAAGGDCPRCSFVAIRRLNGAESRAGGGGDAAAAVASPADATDPAQPAPAERDLPRDRARCRVDDHLRVRRRPLVPPRAAWARDGRARLADRRVVPHGDPLPPDRRVRARVAFDGHAAHERRLRAGVQPPAAPLGPPLRRPLRLVGHPRRGPSARRYRVRPEQPRARRARGHRRGVAVELLRTPVRLRWRGYTGPPWPPRS